MTFPLSNALILKLTGPATAVDEYLEPTGAAPVLWTGRAAGYLKRARRSGQSSGEQVKGATDTFTILDSTLAPVIALAGPEWDSSTVTILDQRVTPAVEVTFQVLGAEHRATGSAVDSVNLELNRASA